MYLFHLSTHPSIHLLILSVHLLILSIHPSICLSTYYVCPLLHPSSYLFYLPLHSPSIYPSIHRLSVHPFTHLPMYSIYLPTYSIHPFIHLSTYAIYPSICLSYLSVHSSISRSIHHLIHPSLYLPLAVAHNLGGCLPPGDAWQKSGRVLVVTAMGEGAASGLWGEVSRDTPSTLHAVPGGAPCQRLTAPPVSARRG